MNIDKDKLDLLFSEDDSDEPAPELMMKPKARKKIKVQHITVADETPPEPGEPAAPAEQPAEEPAAQLAEQPAGEPAEGSAQPAARLAEKVAVELPEAAEPDDPEDFAVETAGDVPEEEKEVIVLHPGKVTNTIFDWIGSLLIALVCVLLAMSFCFRVIDVDGVSMEPTLVNTDKVIITDLFYTPHNGDIIIISHGEEYPKPLVKRVIAIPGQTLEIDYEAGTVRVDGELLDESAYTQGFLKDGDLPAEEINGVIPEGKLFVMGDNRTVSLDSRSHSIGLIDLDCVIGKAQLDVVPHSYSEGQIPGKDLPAVDLSRIRYLY